MVPTVQISIWHIALDVSALFVVLGILIALTYEAVAIFNHSISATPTIPRITDIIRPWASDHRMIFLAICAAILAAFFWMFFHFLLPAR